MLRGALETLWDLSVFLDVEPKTFLSRFNQREKKLGEFDEQEEIPIGAGFQVYETESRPRTKASIVVNFDDIQHPVLLMNCTEETKENFSSMDNDEILAEIIEQIEIEATNADKLYGLDTDMSRTRLI